MPIQQWLEAIYAAQLATAIRESTLFPWIESIHVLAATTLVGTIAIADLRLVGYPAHRRGAREVLLDLLPYTWGAFAVAVITGSLLFASNAPKYATDPPFLAKMAMLMLAGINMAIFHTTAYRTIATWNERLPPPRAVRIAGATSLGFWIIVVFLGRWIGFALNS